MDNSTIKNLSYFGLLFFVCTFFATDFAYASYQKIAPGSVVTLGEFVFDDDFVATTTPCWIGITNPLNVEVVASTTLMTAQNDGWHYYSYTTASDAPAGLWPSVMKCGSVAGGDLVMVDKSFIVDWSIVSTSSIKTVVDGSLTIATSSLAAVINTNTNAAVLAASSSLFATLPSTIWSFSGRTLTSFGTLITDTVTAVWASASRTLTGASLDSGSLATLSDVQAATSSVASAITAGTTAVNSNTNAQVLSASTSVVALVNLNTDAQIATAVSSINTNIDAEVLSASTSLAVSIPNAVWSATTRSLTTFGTLAADTATAVWAAGSRTLTGFGTLAADVWASGTRTLTGASLGSGSLATLADVQTATSSLAAAITAGTTAVNSHTDAQILAASTSLASFITSNSNATILAASTSLATYLSAYTSAASSSIASFVNANTNSTILAASTSLAAFINTHTDAAILAASSSLAAEIAKGYTVTLSDFGDTTVNTAYKAKLQILNYATTPTDADSLPTVVVTDPVGTVQVPSGVMTKDSNGTYSYSYSISGSAVGGVWETVVSAVIHGETVRLNDYWSLSSSPADVQIIDITDRVIPTITASVRIDNMGTSASDFYYVYCVVASEDNLCGGNDDVDSGSDTAYINAGGFINLSLSLDEVPAAGTYWFKVKARALAETLWAASTEQFTAESGAAAPPPSSGGGGGGGGGGGPAAAVIPTVTPGSSNGADFNGDNKVNSVDFSILLAFWQKKPPFSNPLVDINKDGKVNSVDFSILLYQWKK